MEITSVRVKSALLYFTWVERWGAGLYHYVHAANGIGGATHVLKIEAAPLSRHCVFCLCPYGTYQMFVLLGHNANMHPKNLNMLDQN